MNRAYSVVLFIFFVYLEGWLLAGNRLVWWSFPTHMLACAGIVLSWFYVGFSFLSKK